LESFKLFCERQENNILTSFLCPGATYPDPVDMHARYREMRLGPSLRYRRESFYDGDRRLKKTEVFVDPVDVEVRGRC